MRERSIILIDLLRTGEIEESSIEFSGLNFRITAHRVGWDFDTAEKILRSQDGFADGFAISGIQKHVGSGRDRTAHPGYLRLLRRVQRTPIYLADDLRELFTEWSLQKISQSEPHLLAGKKILFQCAAVSPALDRFEQSGVRLQAADALILGGIPRLIEGRSEFNSFMKLARQIHRFRPIESLKPDEKILSASRLKRLVEWAEGADGFVTFGSLLDRVISPDGSADLLAALENKLLIVDYLTPETRARIEASRVGQVLELVPQIPGLEELPVRHFSILTAVLDQCRQAEHSRLSFDEYVLRAIQEKEVKPARLSRTHRKAPVRCAFIIHPLQERDIFRHPALAWLEKSPKLVRETALKGIERVPGFHYGTIRGVVSEHSGQEVICDLYTLPTTPRQIMAMPEERLYSQLLDVAKLAHKRGASILGLGAYTKVAGDAGVTVARHSPIPVTNGNSYSASTTLWAARLMSEKMGFISLDPRHRNQRNRQKAMVIGATGSIGRVSALLVSRVTDELVLVAQRADKLLELREEVARLSPDIVIKVTTQADDELADTDLIVTATSNTLGQIFDIARVKPGAVICDCSRPLDVSAEMAALRPDVMVIQSGEVELPGLVEINCDIGLPKPAVYACLAETIVLSMEGRFENFSLSKILSMERVKEIYRLGLKHGARLSAIQTHHGIVTDAMIHQTRALALARLGNIGQSSQPNSLTDLGAGRKPWIHANWQDQTILPR